MTIVLLVFIIAVCIYGYIRLKLKYAIGRNNNNINGNSNNELAVLNDDSSKLNDLVTTAPKIKQTGDNNGDAVHRTVQF